MKVFRLRNNVPYSQKVGALRAAIEFMWFITRHFGMYFRYMISLKASFDDGFVEEAKENYRTFTLLLLSSIKSQEAYYENMYIPKLRVSIGNIQDDCAV